MLSSQAQIFSLNTDGQWTEFSVRSIKDPTTKSNSDNTDWNQQESMVDSKVHEHESHNDTLL